jgi:hypothetical protein
VGWSTEILAHLEPKRLRYTPRTPRGLRHRSMNTIAAAALLAGSALMSFAQQDAAQPKSLPAYRIQLILRDSEVGQQPAERKFMTVIEEKEWARLRTGAKIPYSTSPNQFNYADVGTNITCRTFDRGDQVKIDYEVEVSNVSKVDPETRNPALHQHKTSGSSTVALDKSTLISTWDEIGSASMLGALR